jgi:hypothetical protein
MLQTQFSDTEQASTTALEQLCNEPTVVNVVGKPLKKHAMDAFEFDLKVGLLQCIQQQHRINPGKRCTKCNCCAMLAD